MRIKSDNTLVASTLVEMLVVIIISGILFIALFDGVDLVKRYTGRLSKTLTSGNSLLDGFQRLDYLFQKSDSIQAKEGIFCFYWGGQQQAIVEIRDSLLCCTRTEQLDTLFRGVLSTRVIPVKGNLALVDSLGVYFVYKGKTIYFPFGLVKRFERESENAIKELEDTYNVDDYDKMGRE